MNYKNRVRETSHPISDDVIEVIEMGTGNVIKATYQSPDQISNPGVWEVPRVSDDVIEYTRAVKALALVDMVTANEESHIYTANKANPKTSRLPPPPPKGTYGPPGEDWKVGWSDCMGCESPNHHYVRVWYSGGRGLTACEQFITKDDLKKKDRKHCPQCQRIKGG